MLAALFDLDGVVVDTEPQYTAFWAHIGQQYYPENPAFPHEIKGHTLRDILSRYFPQTAQRAAVTAQLEHFEHTMDYPYVPGVRAFLERLGDKGIPTAVVTSSNSAKMSSLYAKRPELPSLFTRIFTAENFQHSKPHPECYTTAARALGLSASDCVVFEDSIAGLQAGRAAGARVVGLTTTLPEEQVHPLCDVCVADFSHIEEVLANI